jgi:basic membrane protein A and related proteins
LYKKYSISILSILAAVLLVIPGCADKIDTVPVQVAMIFDSPIASDAFSLACLLGAERAKAEFGIGLDFSVSATTSETEKIQRKYTESKQYNLIICVGSNQTDSLRKIGTDFSRQKFAQVDGDITDRANISSLLSRDNESSFLAGALAAMITRNNHIGFIGGMDVTAIHRFLAGFQAGVKYNNPECKIAVAYSDNWTNDGKTKALALQQFQQGVDVIFASAGAGNLGVIESAKEQGLYTFGMDTDQSSLAPQNILASAVKHMDRAVFEAIKRSVEGNFSGGIQTTGLKEGEVELAINNALPAITPEMRIRLAEIEKKIISGEIIVPVD